MSKHTFSPEILRDNPLSQQIAELFTIEGDQLRHNFEKVCHIDGKLLEAYQDPDLIKQLLAFHKILFMTGGDAADVITAKDPWGNYIYTKLFYREVPPDPESPDFREINPVKEGEVQEASSAISAFIQRVESRAVTGGKKSHEMDLAKFLGPFEFPEVLSEIADVFYNLLNIHTLDDTYDYTQDIVELCRALGFSPEQAFKLVVAKYHARYVTQQGIKNIEDENLAVARLIEAGEIPLPTLGKLSKGFGEIHIIVKRTLEPRLLQLETQIRRQAKQAINFPRLDDRGSK